MNQVLSVRRYTRDGKFIRANQYDNMPIQKVRAFVQALLRMAKLFSDDDIAPLNPCNVSLRAANGRFTSWK